MRRKRCENCKHWTRDPVSLLEAHGDCALMEDSNDVSLKSLDDARVYAWDYEGYTAGTYVGKNFLCMHFQSKGEKE